MKYIFVARRGASFYSELSRAQRGQWSEEVKNREGVASGSATFTSKNQYKNLTECSYLTHSLNKPLRFLVSYFAMLLFVLLMQLMLGFQLLFLICVAAV